MYIYCQYCNQLPDDHLHRRHHDTIYGIAIHDDNALYGRLLLEINQAGLCWDTILKKEDHFFQAYSQFQIKKISQYADADIERLLSDPGIIRNKLKIHAAILNATKVLDIQKSHGSFFNWIRDQDCEDMKAWVKLFRSHFKFVGGEIVHEFLMTIGRIEGSHHPDCHRFIEYSKKRKEIWNL